MPRLRNNRIRVASSHRWRPAWLIVGAVLLAGTAWAESGILLKDTDLRHEPLGSAEVVKQLPANQKVEVTSRQGAWAAVTAADGSQGWIRILNLRTGTGEKARSGFGAMASMFTTGSSGKSASTGVKGLTADQLRKAKPNYPDADALSGLAVSNEDAETFGQDGKLQSITLAYLPENIERGEKK